jgi:hypothetical protein
VHNNLIDADFETDNLDNDILDFEQINEAEFDNDIEDEDDVVDENDDADVISHVIHKRAATARSERLWDHAVIPYEIEANFSGMLHSAVYCLDLLYSPC